ncbi:UNVERIFIED_CONTAM: hypothetical protein GTU68_062606 [Idotea baltica]|nr:hypothetical protein [Idotea baltica]
MLAVIFEVWPHEAHRESYLKLAANMKRYLEDFDGFISVERFESLTEPGKLLSVSFWRDEAALDNWRKLEEHRAMQKKGRESLFRDYHLRIASVIRDYTLERREEAPEDSKALHG